MNSLHTDRVAVLSLGQLMAFGVVLYKLFLVISTNSLTWARDALRLLFGSEQAPPLPPWLEEHL